MASSQQRLIYFKAASAGAFAATDAVLARNLTSRLLEGDYASKDEMTGQDGMRAEELRRPHSGAEFSIEAGGGIETSGTLAAPSYDDMLLACGLAKTASGQNVAYTPLNSGTPAPEGKLLMRTHDQMQEVGAVRGSLSFTANVNERPMWTLNMMGSYADPVSAGTAPSPDFSGWVAPAKCTAENIPTLTIGGATLCLNTLSISDGRNPQVGKFMNCAGTDIAQRGFTGRITGRWPDLATKDLIQGSHDELLEALVFRINEVATGTHLTIGAPKVQVKFAGVQDIGGELGFQADLNFTPDQGDDEITFTFSSAA
ncbi:MAG: phage tail tube protein [Pseudomonadota bacterium]